MAGVKRFFEESLQSKLQLRDSVKAGLTWMQLKCEATGIARLSRLVVSQTTQQLLRSKK